MRDKIEFTCIHFYRELAFIFILFLTDAYFFSVHVVFMCICYNTIQCDTIELGT